MSQLSRTARALRDLLEQLAVARVYSRCGCGCPTIDLAVGDRLAATAAGSEIVADAFGLSPEGVAIDSAKPSTALSIVENLPSRREIVFKTVVTHTVTYFVSGIAAFVLFDYPTLIAENTLGLSMRPLSDPMVMAGPLLQPVRGLLFGLVFYVLREPFFGRKKGWLVMWLVLVSVGILGTFGAPPGSLEGAIYTVLPFSLHLKLLPEVLVQSLLLSWLVFHWVNHRERKWLNWTMGAAFVVVLLFPLLGLVVTLRR